MDNFSDIPLQITCTEIKHSAELAQIQKDGLQIWLTLSRFPTLLAYGRCPPQAEASSGACTVSVFATQFIMMRVRSLPPPQQRCASWHNSLQYFFVLYFLLSIAIMVLLKVWLCEQKAAMGCSLFPWLPPPVSLICL